MRRSGWAAVAEPSAVKKNAAVEKSSGSGTVGTATKCDTRTTKILRRRRARFGVITSSSPSRVQSARRWLTETDPTLAPAKSRLNCDRDCVARATIVTVPSSG